MLIVDDRKPVTNRSFQWIFYLVASFYLGTVFLRSILIYGGDPELIPLLGMLFIWAALFAGEPFISRKWPNYVPFYLLVQTGLVFALLASPGYTDFFANLLAILSMQVMQHFNTRIWLAWMGACVLTMTMLLMKTYGGQTYALVLIYTAGNVFYGFYAQATRRAQAIHTENLVLVHDLQEANQKIQAYSNRMEQLVVARERNRLARDLHDSVTQTVFSMTLTTQSALLLLERDPGRIGAQLDRMNQLARNALSEMQLLISELKPEETGKEGMITTLRNYLSSGYFPENLSVDLDVVGERSLGFDEEQGLFHIIQEALNNVMKHAHASRAQVRVHLTEPMWIEIEDHGKGFDLEQALNSGRVGLSSMRERAAEIGWDLHVSTSPEAGTCIRVEKMSEEVRQA